MDELERQEREAEQAAREDYLREGMDPGDTEPDHDDYLWQVWLNSLTPEEYAAREAARREARARMEEAESHGIDMDDDVPF